MILVDTLVAPNLIWLRKRSALPLPPRCSWRLTRSARDRLGTCAYASWCHVEELLRWPLDWTPGSYTSVFCSPSIAILFSGGSRRSTYKLCSTCPSYQFASYRWYGICIVRISESIFRLTFDLTYFKEANSSAEESSHCKGLLKVKANAVVISTRLQTQAIVSQDVDCAKLQRGVWPALGLGISRKVSGKIFLQHWAYNWTDCDYNYEEVTPHTRLLCHAPIL